MKQEIKSILAKRRERFKIPVKNQKKVNKNNIFDEQYD